MKSNLGRSRSRVVLAALLASAFACSKPAQEQAPTEPASNQPSSAAPATTPNAAPAAPPDLDVGVLKKKLACSGDDHRQTCRFLAEFERAERFVPRIPSGQGRFIGQAYRQDKGAEVSELMLLSVEQVPIAKVPLGELPLKIGTSALPQDRQDHGVKLVNALSRGDTVSKANQALPFLKSWTPSDAPGSMQTAGVSIRSVKEELYLRQGDALKVLMVRLGPNAREQDAVIAELWPASW